MTFYDVTVLMVQASSFEEAASRVNAPKECHKMIQVSETPEEIVARIKEKT